MLNVTETGYADGGDSPSAGLPVLPMTTDWQTARLLRPCSEHVHVCMESRVNLHLMGVEVMMKVCGAFVL